MATPLSPDFDPFLSPPPLTKIHPALRYDAPSPSSKSHRLTNIINSFRSPRAYNLSPPPPPPPLCFSEKSNRWKPLPPIPVLRSWSEHAERAATPSKKSFCHPIPPAKRDISSSTVESNAVTTSSSGEINISYTDMFVADETKELDATVVVTNSSTPGLALSSDQTDKASSSPKPSEGGPNPTISATAATTPISTTHNEVATKPDQPPTSPVTALPEKNDTPSPDGPETGGVPLTPHTPNSPRASIRSGKSAWWLTPTHRTAVYHLCSPIQSCMASPCIATPCHMTPSEFLSSSPTEPSSVYSPVSNVMFSSSPEGATSHVSGSQRPSTSPAGPQRSHRPSPAPSTGTMESSIEHLRLFVDSAASFADGEESDVARREAARLAGMLVQRAVDVCELHQLG